MPSRLLEKMKVREFARARGEARMESGRVRV
jgi:hypothetical protein